MIPRIRRISTRFALLLAFAAVLPLVVYGLVSIITLQRGTRNSVVAGDLNVATRAADEIRRYVSTNGELLKALAADLQNTGLEPWQQDRILKNYVLQFREFREITLFAEDGGVVATSRVGKPRVGIPAATLTAFDGVRMSPIRIDEELLPTTTFGLHLMRLNQPSGWLVGEFSLEQMWRMVDQIRIGERGFALVATADGTLVAHGDPDKKALVAQGQKLTGNPLITGPLDGASAWREIVDDDGVRQLAVAARIEPLHWTVLVEQPTDEAYAHAAQLRRQLIAAIGVGVLVMIAIGYLFGRSFINPIQMLQRGTNAVASGQLDTRVNLHTRDELGELGSAFNTMADRLVQLQEDVKRQERQATFGRIAAGLVHDLSHPIQNIGNSTRLLLRDDIDVESRAMFHRTIERELATLKRFMDDLRNLVKPKPIERFAMDLNAAVAEIVDSMRVEGERNGIAVELNAYPDPLVIEGDRFALGRVFRNLVTNAIQATPDGGRVAVTTTRDGQQVQVVVADTGSGIAPERLGKIFEDYVTTKRHGLGLGLAISKRIVEQLDGTIAVASEVGRGTTFTLRFPAREVQTAAAS